VWVTPVGSVSRTPPSSTLFPYTTLFRSLPQGEVGVLHGERRPLRGGAGAPRAVGDEDIAGERQGGGAVGGDVVDDHDEHMVVGRSEEHTSELQSRFDLVCRLLLEKKTEQ